MLGRSGQNAGPWHQNSAGKDSSSLRFSSNPIDKINDHTAVAQALWGPSLGSTSIMAAKAASRSVGVLQPMRHRLFCPSCFRQLPKDARRLSRAISTATVKSSEMEVESHPRPRWSQTPPAMKAPIRSRPKPPNSAKPIPVNDSPQKLDQAYARFFGSEELSLSEETKWLAITHKSFDFGRRGYNDRLAFFGQ